MPLLPFLLPLAATARTAITDTTPPVVKIDLDAPPASRWDALIAEYNTTIWASVEQVKASSSTYKALLAAADAIFHNESASGWLPREHWDEIVAVSHISKLPIGVLIALNALYDVTASKNVAHHACTSIVAQDADGSVLAGRNLDYSLKAAMTNITVTAEWQRSGRTVFTSVMYVGTIGFNTVQRTGAWSLTHDERDQGFIGVNWADMFLRHRILTFSTIRQVADTAATFNDAVNRMREVPLIAPSFFVLAGTRSGEGVLLTRGRDGGDVDVYPLDAPQGRWFLVETNYDHWVAPPTTPFHGDDRRDPAERALTLLTQANATAAGLLSVLSDQHCNASRGERNVLNSHTVYTAIMLPGQTGVRVVLRSAPRAECGSGLVLQEAVA